MEINTLNFTGVVNVDYEVVQNMSMTSNPVELTFVEACLNVTNGVTMNISSTGDLFTHLRAKDFVFFEDQVTQFFDVRESFTTKYDSSFLSSVWQHP